MCCEQAFSGRVVSPSVTREDVLLTSSSPVRLSALHRDSSIEMRLVSVTAFVCLALLSCATVSDAGDDHSYDSDDTGSTGA